MATPRVLFAELPDTVRRRFEAKAGAVVQVKEVSDGRHSAVCASVRTMLGTFFVKGLPLHHRQISAQRTEASINQYVVQFSPRVVEHFQLDGWDILVSRYLDGPHADYAPGSADLPKVADLIRDLGRLPCPDIGLQHAEDRWRPHTDTPGLFKGDHLLHTDWHPKNVLIPHMAYLCDWAWATRGAGWIDAACWVIWLISFGHPPVEAEAWAARVPLWKTASTDAVDAFAKAQSSFWTNVAAAKPHPGAHEVAAAAQRWTDHRQTRR